MSRARRFASLAALLTLATEAAEAVTACPAGQVIQWYTSSSTSDGVNSTCVAPLVSSTCAGWAAQQGGCSDVVFAQGSQFTRAPFGQPVCNAETGYQTWRRNTSSGVLAAEGQAFANTRCVNAPPPPPTCSAAGTPYGNGGAVTFTNVSNSDKQCVTSGSLTCELVAGDSAGASVTMYLPSQRILVGKFKYTGNPCSGSQTPAPSNDNCATGGGKTICKGTGNCGTFNGEQRCLEQTTPGTCVRTQSGNGFCVTSGNSAPGDRVTTPPGPDNGTAGSPAQADGQMSTFDGQGNSATQSWYSAGTQAGSTTTMGGPGAADAGTDDSGGGGGSGGSGDDDGMGCGGPGEPACRITGQCGGPGQPKCEVNFGTPGADPALGQVGTFGAITSGFMARVENSALVSSFTGLGDSLPTGGECPTAEFELWEQVFVIDAHCDLFADVAWLIHLIMMIAYGIVSVRVVLGA